MFISRLVRGGLAESTGLLGVNDEILEVNGIDVVGKSLDQVKTDLRPYGTKCAAVSSGGLKGSPLCSLWCQVTDMLVANSHNLIVTVKPANQRNNVVHRRSKNNSPNNPFASRYGTEFSCTSHHLHHYHNSDVCSGGNWKSFQWIWIRTS